MLKLSTLVKLCSFFNEASIEDDMVKRIMLSIIPSLQTPNERLYTGGFDYKALRAAVNGAKDLVHYGTLACGTEASFSYNNGQTDGEIIKDYAKRGQYIEGLQLALRKFRDTSNFHVGVTGGLPWVKITNVLLNIEQHRIMLNAIRNEARAPNRDPNADYIQDEMTEMKEIVILMNTFDGLVHNSGEILPKLIREEGGTHNGLELDVDAVHRIRRLLDAKEMQNPIDVYKSLQDIIEKPENKHLFGDWITRMRSNPEFWKQHDPQQELAHIRVKKQFITVLKLMSIDELIKLKDALLNIKKTTSPQEVSVLLNQIKSNLLHNRNMLEAINTDDDAFMEIPDNQLLQSLSIIRKLISTSQLLITTTIQKINLSADNAINSIANDIHKLRNELLKLEVAVEEI